MYKSCYKTIRAALVSALTRAGVHVGGTAGYPRVEPHSFVENPPQDKGDALRVLNCIVESLSVKSSTEAAEINDANVALLEAFNFADTSFRVVAVVPTQLQNLTETSDPQKILYRVLQTIDIYVQQL